MQTTYITNAFGIRFYIEAARDFDDMGRNVEASGVYAGIIQGNCELSGVWFETREAALSAISTYGG